LARSPWRVERLTPPGERVRVVTHEGGIRDGAQVSLRVGPKPFALRWDLEHRDLQPGRSFTDLQFAGPFRYWKHVHRMVPLGPQASVLEDAIEYEVPLGTIGWLVGRLFVQRKLKRLFTFRHAVTRQAFEHPPV